MPFADHERESIITKARSKYTSYWHAMHPVTYEPQELYRAAWPDNQWEAISLLMEEHREAVSTHYYFEYQSDFSNYLNRPDWIPKKPKLTFRQPKDMPFACVTERQVGDQVAMDMRRWILKAYHFRAQRILLHNKLRTILHRFVSHTDGNGRQVRTAIVNTPRILHRVWPEVTPFMDSMERSELRNSRTKCPLPQCWDKDDHDEFIDSEDMEKLSIVLLAVGMIDDRTDEKYPSLSG